MPRLNLPRRHFLRKLLVGSAIAGALPVAGIALARRSLLNPCASPLPRYLADHPIVTAAWEGIVPAQFWDSHAHIAGIGDAGSGILTSPDMQSLWHPLQFVQRRFYLNAACTHNNRVDQSYVERMQYLLDGLMPGCKLMLLAFERTYDETGNPQPERTAFYVPNAYAQDIAHRYPGHFEWICSIHPYRKDAIAALESAVSNGARAVKWLPSAMGIDPASPKCDAFYRALARLDVPLICHTGEELALHGADFQDAGNPLKLRRSLEAGVQVVAAHCASIGEDIDLDKGANGPRVPSFELFARLMAETHYQHHLFADISAIAFRNRSADVLRAIIEHHEWHSRLLNGTDYPLPGVLPLTSLDKWSKAGLLDGAVVPVLNEIQNYNPLLFDFVLKRHLRAGAHKFPASVFHTRDFFLRKGQ